MHGQARDTRAVVSATVALAFVLAACAASATPVPSGDGGLATTGPSGSPAASASAAVAVDGSPSGSGAPSAATSSNGPSAGASATASVTASATASAVASPAASGSVAPLPPPGAAHGFGCASLLSNKQVTAATHMTSVLYTGPPGQAPKPPKGETICKYFGNQPGPNKTFDILTTEVYVLTDGARATFDATWAQYRGSPLVDTVDGVGDDAAWLAPQLTLVGIRHATAFVVTLEPLPASIFTPESARATAAALARIVASHL